MSASYRRRCAVHADPYAEQAMFSTLVESRAVRRRNVRGAAISVVSHTLLIATAVALTYPTAVAAPPDAHTERPPVFVPAPVPVERTHTSTPAPSTPTVPHVPVIMIPVPNIV